MRIAEIIAHGFANDFLPLTGDLKKAAAAISGIIVVSRFFVAELKGCAHGVLACSDTKGRAMSIHRPDSIGFMGQVRALVCERLFHCGIRLPAYYSPETGYIEFVAVDEKKRGQGVATALLAKVVSDTPYSEYLLDVEQGNAPARRCYEKFGFIEIGREVEIKENPRRVRNKVYMGYVRELVKDKKT